MTIYNIITTDYGTEIKNLDKETLLTKTIQ